MQRFHHPLDQAVFIHGVRPDALEGDDGFGNFVQDALGVVIVLVVGSVGNDIKQIADGVHHEMMLVTFAPLPASKPRPLPASVVLTLRLSMPAALGLGI